MALLIYSVLRILLVVGAGAVLYLLGVRSWLLVLGAVLIGAGLSYVLLEGPRRRAADAMAARRSGAGRFSQSLADEAADEDAEADLLAGAAEDSEVRAEADLRADAAAGPDLIAGSDAAGEPTTLDDPDAPADTDDAAAADALADSDGSEQQRHQQ